MYWLGIGFRVCRVAGFYGLRAILYCLVCRAAEVWAKLALHRWQGLCNPRHLRGSRVVQGLGLQGLGCLGCFFTVFRVFRVFRGSRL